MGSPRKTSQFKKNSVNLISVYKLKSIHPKQNQKQIHNGYNNSQ